MAVLLPALVLGPPAVGAPWQVLAASPAPDLTHAQHIRLHEILASLAHWASSGESPIMALLPLGAAATHAPAPALLLRAASGSAIGPNALPQAIAVIVPADVLAALDGRAERLLPLLPLPGGRRNFGDVPFTVPPALPVLPLREGWEDIGIAWRNRAVMVPEVADVLPALATVLANAGPPEKLGRITGWATTAILEPAGEFDPWDDCQLLVLGPGHRVPYDVPYLQAHSNGVSMPVPTIEPPAAWRAWAAFRQIAGTADLLPWDDDMILEPVPALLTRLAIQAGTDRCRRTVLIRALITACSPGPADFGAELRAAGLQLLARWLEQDGAADLADDDCADDCGDLNRATMLAALASLDEPGQALAQMQPSRVLWLVDGLIGHAAVSGPAGSAASIWLAQHRPGHAALPAIITARLAGMPGNDLARMATAPVLAALGPRHVDVALRVTAACLPRPTASLASIAASLTALQLAAACLSAIS